MHEGLNDNIRILTDRHILVESNQPVVQHHLQLGYSRLQAQSINHLSQLGHGGACLLMGLVEDVANSSSRAMSGCEPATALRAVESMVNTMDNTLSKVLQVGVNAKVPQGVVVQRKQQRPKVAGVAGRELMDITDQLVAEAQHLNGVSVEQRCLYQFDLALDADAWLVTPDARDHGTGADDCFGRFACVANEAAGLVGS